MAEDNQLRGDLLQQRLLALVHQWGRGQASLKQIVGLTEEELYAIANQGYYLFLQGKAEPARVLFEGLVAMDPRNAYYYRALGAIYWRLREAPKALRQLSYAIRVAPQDILSYINRAEIYVAEKQFALARPDLHFAMAHAQPHEETLRNKARAILQMIG